MWPSCGGATNPVRSPGDRVRPDESDPESGFLQSSGLVGLSHLMSVLLRRHILLDALIVGALAEIGMASANTPSTGSRFSGARR